MHCLSHLIHYAILFNSGIKWYGSTVIGDNFECVWLMGGCECQTFPIFTDANVRLEVNVLMIRTIENEYENQ